MTLHQRDRGVGMSTAPTRAFVSSGGAPKAKCPARTGEPEGVSAWARSGARAAERTVRDHDTAPGLPSGRAQRGILFPNSDEWRRRRGGAGADTSTPCAWQSKRPRSGWRSGRALEGRWPEARSPGGGPGIGASQQLERGEPAVATEGTGNGQERSSPSRSRSGGTAAPKQPARDERSTST